MHFEQSHNQLRLVDRHGSLMVSIRLDYPSPGGPASTLNRILGLSSGRDSTTFAPKEGNGAMSAQPADGWVELRGDHRKSEGDLWGTVREPRPHQVVHTWELHHTAFGIVADGYAMSAESGKEAVDALFPCFKDRLTSPEGVE